MKTRKKYRQLKFYMDSLKEQYHAVFLIFRINNNQVHGILNGNAEDWIFTSTSSYFLKYIPGGTLSKYAMWIGSVPKTIGHFYLKITESAARAGYELCDKEEEAANE
ncbi:MAG TPA: hypothetical protein VEY06_15175 [Flavisolibacter sp.]|nr:hypothetical protein [Flavisolibacter sp.]